MTSTLAQHATLLLDDHYGTYVSTGHLWVNIVDSTTPAVADGVTDNKAAIQATITAVNAAGGGTVYVPPAALAYGCTSAGPSLNVLSNVRLLGGGNASILKDILGNSSILSLTNSVNASIENLALTGTGVLGTAGRGAIFASTGALRCKVRNVWIENVGTCGISFTSTTGCEVSGVYIRNTAEHGFYASSGNVDLMCSNIHVIDAGQNGGVSTVVGFKITCTGFTLSNFSVTNALTEGIMFETGCTDATVSNGTIRLCNQRGLRANSGTSGTVSNVTFIGNVTGGVRDFGAASLILNGCIFDQAAAFSILTQTGANGLSVMGGKVINAPAGTYAVDLTGNNANIFGLVIGSSVTLGIATRAGATATRLMNVQNFASGTKLSDSGTGTIQLDVAASFRVASGNPTGGTDGDFYCKTDGTAAGADRLWHRESGVWVKVA